MNMNINSEESIESNEIYNEIENNNNNNEELMMMKKN